MNLWDVVGNPELDQDDQVGDGGAKDACDQCLVYLEEATGSQTWIRKEFDILFKNLTKKESGGFFKEVLLLNKLYPFIFLCFAFFFLFDKPLAKLQNNSSNPLS